MDKEFLSICIPTRNRSLWLGRALSQLASEIDANKIGPDVLKIYVSDNCSTDDTESIIKIFQARLPHLIYSRQPSNIGGDPNILHCCNLGAGEYRWVMGDDDTIEPKTLGYILDCLRKFSPALFLNSDGRYACGFKTPKLFGSYREFSQTCMQVNPHMLLAHSLITGNIFRADCFKYDFAISKMETSYGHMYGMVGAMADVSGGVFITDRQTIRVRDSSLDPVDGVWPVDMYKLWGDYLDWIKQRFDLDDINREDIPKYIRRALILGLKAHPLETAWRYGKNLNRKQTWQSFWKLLKRTH
jgi:glycosyltransferase involved in cell wall biosynthesis